MIGAFQRNVRITTRSPKRPRESLIRPRAPYQCSQSCPIRVRKRLNCAPGTLHIRKTKTNKDRHIVLTDEGRDFFSELAAGKPGAAPLLNKEWKPSYQAPLMVEACKRASIHPPLNFHALRHTWASLSVMGGMPLMVVAKNLGHSDTRMVEKHYGHLAPSYVAEAIRKHASKFGKTPSNVRAL